MTWDEARIRVRTCNQILVKSVHCLDVSSFNFESGDIGILQDPLLLDALWERNEAVLQRPPYEELPGRA